MRKLLLIGLLAGSLAAQVINGGSGGGSGLFTTPTTLKLPGSVTSCNGYGDSVTAGVQLQTGQTTQVWFNLVAAAWNTAIGTNFAANGSRLNQAGQTSSAYAQAPSTTVCSMMMVGTNEMVDATSAGNRTQIGNAQMAMLAWLALPASQKILATAMTQAGTWATTTDFTLTSVFNSTLNATLTTATTLTGTACYVAGAWGSGLNWNFDVLIDGASQTAGAGFQSTWGLTASGHYPWALRFGGLTNTAHTIQVKALSATTASADVQWVGCNGASAPGIFVAEGGMVLQNTIPNGNITALNTIFQNNVNSLFGDGLSTYYVDLYTAMLGSGTCAGTNPTLFNNDCVHPNVLGNEVMAGAFLDTLGAKSVTATQLIAFLKAYLGSSGPTPNTVSNTTNCGTASGNSWCAVAQYTAAANAQWAGRPASSGTCVFVAATTCTVTYSVAFVATPVLTITPVNPGAVTFTITATSNTAATITASGSNSLTVNWLAIGNPN